MHSPGWFSPTEDGRAATMAVLLPLSTLLALCAWICITGGQTDTAMLFLGIAVALLLGFIWLKHKPMWLRVRIFKESKPTEPKPLYETTELSDTELTESARLIDSALQ